MATKNPEDEGRFLKDLFRGVPANYGLTPGESSLRELTRISDQLRDLRERHSLLAPRESSEVQVLPAAPPPPPETHIEVHVPDVSRELSPYLQDISDAQRETAEGIGTLTHQGQQSLILHQQSVNLEGAMALESRFQTDQGDIALRQRRKILDQTRHAVMVLESLDEQGRTAYLQRLALLQGIASTHSAIENMDAHIVEKTGQVLTGIQTLQRQGESTLEELQRQTGSLDEMVQLETQGLQEQRVNTASLRRIESGVGDLIGLTAEQNAHLAEISEGIAESIAITAKAVDHLAHIEGSIDMFVLTTRDIRRELGHIADTLRKPAEVHAFNVWEIGERCRRGGDMGTALNKFGESHKENPSEWRNYYSLGMMCLEIGDTEGAQDFFHQGTSYAQHEGLESEAKLHLALGKVLYLKEQFDDARMHLELAYEKDQRNFEVWYYLALLEMKIGDSERTLAFIRPLLQLARQGKAPGYFQKIMNEPEFQSIHSQIMK